MCWCTSMADPDPRTSGSEGYVFKSHERALIVGSPATPDHPALRKAGYLLVGVYLALLSGCQNGLLLANLNSLQGYLALTPVEGGCVTVSYNLTNACMSALFFKVRQEFGVSRRRRSTFNHWAPFGAGEFLDWTARCDRRRAASC